MILFRPSPRNGKKLNLIQIGKKLTAPVWQGMEIFLKLITIADEWEILHHEQHINTGNVCIFGDVLVRNKLAID